MSVRFGLLEELVAVDGIRPRRVAHRLGFPILALFLTWLWLQEALLGFPNLAHFIGLPILVGQLVLFTLHAWRNHAPALWCERLALATAIFYVLIAMTVSLAIGRLGVELAGYAAYLPLLYGATVLTLGPRMGLRVSAVVYAASLALVITGGVIGQVVWTDVTPLALGHLLLVGVAVAIATTYKEHLIHRLRLQREAHLDPLTLATNRRGGVHYLDRIRTPYALLVLDLDAFKHINDHHGHATGDTVLMRCAQAFRQVLRPDDLLVRWGGDEFVIVTEMASHEDVEHLADRLRQAARSVGDGLGVPLDVSVGTAFGTPDRVWQHVISEADAAMYESKERQRRAQQSQTGVPFGEVAT